MIVHINEAVEFYQKIIVSQNVDEELYPEGGRPDFYEGVPGF